MKVKYHAVVRIAYNDKLFIINNDMLEILNFAKIAKNSYFVGVGSLTSF